ncbi:hypothetical protein [Chlorobium ferrooxidans]|nr:hypothetical protein [Chlorobium ferrooxidans]
MDNKPKKQSLHLSNSTLEYCRGNVEWAEALDLWISFMKEEERYSFYRHFVSQSFADAKISIQLLIDRQKTDPSIRMPLLRDTFMCYSRPFTKSRGRLGVKYCIKKDIGSPAPKMIHDKVITERDQLYAHCDLSPLQPRLSLLGISLKGSGYYWDNYVKILPDILGLIEHAILLTENYTNSLGMSDVKTYFKHFEETGGLEEQEPTFLNELYGYE